MNKAAFRRYLAAKMKQAGGQGKLAEAMGEHRPTLSRIISGHRDPTDKVLSYLGLEAGYEFIALPKRPEEEI